MRTLISLLLLCASLRGGGSDVVVVVGQPAAGAPASTLNTSLICYWKMDEASGSRADSEPTGTPRNLIDNNTVTSGTGLVHTLAGQFTAANTEFLSDFDSADLSTGDIDFTVAAWVNPDSLGAGRFIVAKTSLALAVEEYFMDITAGDQFRFYIYNGAFRVATTTAFSPSVGNWYLVVGWYDATANTVNVCVNDGTVFNFSTSPGPNDTGGLFEVGSYRAGTTWNGRIGPVMFWKKVLSAAEITELYGGGAGKPCCPF